MTTATLVRRILWGQRGAFALSALAFCLVYALALALGLLTRALFDAVARGAGDDRGFLALVAALVGAGLGRGAVFHGLPRAQAAAEHAIAAALRHTLLAALLRPGAPVPPAGALDRFRDEPDTVATLVNPACNTLALAAFGIAALALMLAASVTVTLGAVLPLLAIAFVARRAGGRAAAAYAATRDATGRVVDLLGAAFGAVETLVVAGATDRLVARLRPLDAMRRRAARREALFAAVVASVYGHLSTLGTGLVLLLAGRALRAGTLGVGDVALFLYLLDYTGGLAGSAGLLVGRYRTAGAALARLRVLLPGLPAETLVGPHGGNAATEAASDAPTGAADPLMTLTITGLTYHHPDTGRGIAAVDLTLARGSFTVLTGRVGAGKTTTLLALLGLLPGTRGTIRWNGAVVDPATWFRPPRSAFTPQEPRLFAGTLRENILLGLDRPDAALAAAVRAAALDRDVAGFAQGLDTTVGPRGALLSGGQVRRVAAARMFVRAPELVVADDLSGALDAATARRLWDRLRADPDLTALVVSHRRAAFLRADRIVVLAAGRIVDAGTLPELLARCAELRALWDAPASEPDAGA